MSFDALAPYTAPAKRSTHRRSACRSHRTVDRALDVVHARTPSDQALQQLMHRVPRLDYPTVHVDPSPLFGVDDDDHTATRRPH